MVFDNFVDKLREKYGNGEEKATVTTCMFVFKPPDGVTITCYDKKKETILVQGKLKAQSDWIIKELPEIRRSLQDTSPIRK